jgi:DNA polymerase IV (DinB-like DNA polymerase)
VDPRRIIAHADLDYFFAQCEEIANPPLRLKPVVVCVYSGRGGDSGAVSTANYIARGYGVKSGMPIAFAKRLLKDIDAAFLPVNRELYDGISTRVMAILRGYADRFEQDSIDEASMDVSVRVAGDYQLAEELARSMKAELMTKERMSCSVGVGPNKVVAKMASDFRKPDGLTVIRPEGIRAFLDPLPVDKLHGIGKVTVKKLQDLGVLRIGDLARYDPDALVRAFGEKLGTYYHRAANGIDDAPVQERGMAEQISRIITLKQDTRAFPMISQELGRICSDIHERLMDSCLLYKSVGIIVVANNLGIYSRSKTLESPAEDLVTIMRTAQDLLARFLEEDEGVIVRRFGVKVSSLLKVNGQQSLAKFIG